MVSNVMRVSPSSKIGDRLIAAAQVAGVLATAWFVWINAVLPRLGLPSLVGIAVQALTYVIVAWICGGVITFAVYLVISLADLPRATGFSMRTSAPAMWFAPAIVLLSAPFAPAFAVSIFLVANATRQLIARWSGGESPAPRLPPLSTSPPLMFHAAGRDTAFLSWSSAPVLVGALTAQAGLVALLWRNQFRAAVLLAISTAILTALSISTGAYRPGKGPGLPHSGLSVVWTFLLAAALTTGGIAFRGRGGRAASAADSPDPGGPSGTEQVTRAPVPSSESLGPAGGFPGVILLPALKPHTMLVAPVPVTPAKFGAPLLVPRGIPFSGEYWMFRWPATRPPLGATIRRGSASELSFHTTDGWPMEMEAHQILDPPVDIKCCSEVQLAIQDSDQYPSTVSMELVLIDRELQGPPQSLGTVPVAPPPPAGQLLSFRIPPITAVRKFDEIKVVYRRATLRADKSARIAIERFVLVP
jgi:hypothetical protein